MVWIICVLVLVFAGYTIANRLGLDAEYLSRSSRPAAPNPGLASISAEAARIHSDLQVADMHGDTLMWRRDLSKRSTRGHLDIPRMIDGNVSVQVFLAVLDAPNDIFSDSIPRDSDQVTKLALVDQWPLKCIGSHHERALFLSKRLHRHQARSKGTLNIIKSKSDLDDHLRRRSGERITGGLLGLHDSIGTSWQEDKLIDLFNAGYRSSVLCHYTDTPLCGSSQGVEKYGLTELGKKMLFKMQTLGMTVDLTHASFKTVEQVLDLTKKPVIFSHIGVSGVYPKPRNLPDEFLQKLADTNGVIGIGFYPEVIDDGLDGIIRSLMYVCERIGPEYAGLGSGFDSTAVAVDVTGLPLVTERLLQQGLSEDDVFKVMGGNVLRVFSENLPVHTEFIGAQ